jgi:hypothetical protein
MNKEKMMIKKKRLMKCLPNFRTPMLPVWPLPICYSEAPPQSDNKKPNTIFQLESGDRTDAGCLILSEYVKKRT